MRPAATRCLAPGWERQRWTRTQRFTRKRNPRCPERAAPRRTISKDSRAPRSRRRLLGATWRWSFPTAWPEWSSRLPASSSWGTWARSSLGQARSDSCKARRFRCQSDHRRTLRTRIRPSFPGADSPADSPAVGKNHTQPKTVRVLPRAMGELTPTQATHRCRSAAQISKGKAAKLVSTMRV